VNVGFSGNGRLDEPVFQLLSEIPARLYAIDCMPNMTGLPDSIVPRLLRGIEILRSKSQVPILLVEHDGYPDGATNDKRQEAFQKTNDRLKEGYELLLKKGIKGLYYMTREELGIQPDDMVDGTHPTDLGMRHLADGYEKKLRQILGQLQPEATLFHPCTQNRDYYDWRARHEAELQMASETDPEIVMIGNSITHFWSGLPADNWHRGDDSWKKLFGKRRVMNMGFGWDRVENILWRIYHGELDGFSAQKIAMMVGTNNFGINKESDIAQGVRQVIEAVRLRQPQAEIYVQAIYPRRGGGQRMEQLNAIIETQVKELQQKDQKLFFINPGEVLKAEPGGESDVKEELYTGDGLHPNDKGYRLIAKKLKKEMGL